MQNQIYKRDFLHKKAVKSKCAETMQLYRAAPNKVTYLINKAKCEYYYKRIASNPNPNNLLCYTENCFTFKAMSVQSTI